MKLILFRGVPGSGKTTTAAKMFPGILKVENDQYFMRDGRYCWSKEELPKAIAWCSNMVSDALSHGMDICVCNTFTKKRFIQHYEQIADVYNADFIVYRCMGHFQNVHGLTDSMVSGFEKNMEDWPGENIIFPRIDPKMTCEVFDVATNETYGRFLDIMHADMFLNGIADTSLASQVQIRNI